MIPMPVLQTFHLVISGALPEQVGLKADQRQRQELPFLSSPLRSIHCGFGALHQLGT